MCRDVLEIGANLSIALKDVDAFERYISQLKTYYTDYASSLPESAYQYEMLGLNLLCLLAKNKIADFHIEMEKLAVEAIQNNPYVRCPVRLEQFIMEGRYNKVSNWSVLVISENVTHIRRVTLQILHSFKTKNNYFSEQCLTQIIINYSIFSNRF